MTLAKAVSKVATWLAVAQAMNSRLPSRVTTNALGETYVRQVGPVPPGSAVCWDRTYSSLPSILSTATMLVQPNSKINQAQALLARIGFMTPYGDQNKVPSDPDSESVIHALPETGGVHNFIAIGIGFHEC